MKRYFNLMFTIVALLGMLSLDSCRKDTVISGDYSYVTFDTQCLGSNLDGSVRVRAFGSGATKALAIESAKRNAVRDIILKGIKSGSPECSRDPLMLEVNAAERYRYYFNSFFADGGAYTQYCSLFDETLTSRVKAKSNTQMSYGVTVTVNCEGLRERLIADGILRP